MSRSAVRCVLPATCRRLLAAFVAAVVLAGPLPLRAASTGSTALLTPQGSGSGTANGDYISTTGGGLNSPYRYFIEVPSGLTRLVVEIFDADIGLGGTGEASSGRDRQRNGSWNTSVGYSLLDPAGTAQTTVFTTGSSTGPTGSDNAWLTLYNATANSVADNFGTASYSNNDGNNNWSAAWSEVDSAGAGPSSGAIQIVSGELRMQDGVSGVPSLEREADLSGSPGLDLVQAFLTFTFRTSNTLESQDEISVDISSDGGGNWTTLETFSDDSSGSRSYNITQHIANNTRVRFIITGGNNSYSQADEFFFVDNLQITDGVKTAGHWELRVDMSSAETTGDDINAMGIRAHDGTSGSGGTELNVYYDSHNQYGVNPPTSGTNSRSYDYFPYLTSGCEASKNDFDYDSNSGDTGSLSFASRDGTFTQSYSSSSLSANDAWRRDTFTGWTSDSDALEYGIWSADLAINSYLVGGVQNGNYANLWMGNFQAAANPPTANPTTDAFRVYLPTDAAAAPVEPYLEQQVRFSGCGLSGPNPPVVGQTSCFTVTVRFVNPTAQAIRFSDSSPTNLVTANIPGGGGVVYAGGAQVSHGSIVSQPSVGGTGDITWNPGTGSPTTLAAGTTAILSYRVNVTPPSSADVPVTGTPASNGTRAQYVDGTGNTTQTWATYLFGPLCGLEVPVNAATLAVVSSFRASRAEDGGVLVEWQTSSETGTAGFNLYRRDAARQWVPVNRELLAGLLHAEQGGTYRFVDHEASPYEPQVYRLEEVEAGGRRRTHGPFAVAVDWDRPQTRQSAAVYEREAHPASRRPEAPDLAGTKALASTTAPVRAGADGVHLSVREGGLYYLSNADVATWLDVTVEKAAKLIADRKLALSRGGLEVAYYPDVPADRSTGKDKEKGALGLFFYGEGGTGIYSDARVYRLQRDGRGLLMQTVAAGTAPPAAGGSFPETLHGERDAFPATVISPDPESDYWFWEFLQGGDPTFGHRTFTLDAPGFAGAGGSLAVFLHGATATGVTDEHQATVSLNGTELGETRWTGIAARQATFPVPAGLLLAAGNQVEVTAHTGSGAPFSIFYVDGFDLSYQRSFQAKDDALAFTSGGSSPVTVGGFSAAGIRLLDVADPLRPRWLTGAAVEPGSPGYRLTFAPAAGARYLAAAPAAFKQPAAVRAWSPPALLAAGNRADYLVVVPAGLRAAGERLADLRQAQGLEAMVVDLDQIMDEFNHGVSSPHAIRAFLAYAYGNWRQPPRYVALAGDGTLDYRNLLGFGDNLVPPLMIQSAGGLFPSDNRLGDVDDDGLPEMAVGRIPVLSAADLDAYTAKIADYEAASTESWTANAVLLADGTDLGADFVADSERIAGQIPDAFNLNRIYLTSVPLADARSQLLNAIDSGTSFVSYMGHGSLDRLSAGGLLTSGDVPGLTNGERLPVLTAMTCTINRFAVPGVPALGELLVKSAGGGAAAVWGPSGLSFHSDARLLAERFYRPGGGERLGDRVLRAIAEFRSLGGDPALPRIYDLLGDPALRLPVPPVTVGSGVSTGE
jgi:peptidase C25-like protein